jgi:lipoate-protein ligase A
MPRVECRLIPQEENWGPEAMASDEILLESLTDHDVALRFYTWKEPTLTLGYFQNHKLIESNPNLAKLPWLRRASGGEALVHHHELTYAIAAKESVTGTKTALFQEKFHSAIRIAIQKLGVIAPETPKEEQKLDQNNLLCFLHHTTQDLTLGFSKIVGSAQRKKKDRILQHGGILLKQSKHTPELPGIKEITGLEIKAEVLESLILRELEFSLGWDFKTIFWSDQEKAWIKNLAESRYKSNDWNLKR